MLIVTLISSFSMITVSSSIAFLKRFARFFTLIGFDSGKMTANYSPPIRPAISSAENLSEKYLEAGASKIMIKPYYINELNNFIVTAIRQTV